MNSDEVAAASGVKCDNCAHYGAHHRVQSGACTVEICACDHFRVSPFPVPVDGETIVVVVPLGSLAKISATQLVADVINELALRADRVYIQRDDTYDEVVLSGKTCEITMGSMPRESIKQSLKRMSHG